MKPPSDVVIFLLDDALLRTASLLVPSLQREEWRREWSAELWHVRRSCIGVDETFSWEAQREITGFCLGAFPDALCLRTQPAKGTPRPCISTVQPRTRSCGFSLRLHYVSSSPAFFPASPPKMKPRAIRSARVRAPGQRISCRQ